VPTLFSLPYKAPVKICEERLMQTINSISKASELSVPANHTTKLTRALLTCGIVAGPLYMVVILVQAFTREGFSFSRHAASLLSNGDLGWIQISNFLLTGLLVILGAIGMRRALHPNLGKVWGPVLMLIGIYGLGMIGGGIFVADPAMGFPVGTPEDATAISTNGILHFVCGGIGFLALIAACLLFARKFAAAGQRAWAFYSLATGVIFFAAFFGIASGSGPAWIMLGFLGAIVLAWTWLSTLSARLLGELRDMQE
jgi:hypothetical protein